jgi:hypothetical protein
LSNKKKRRKASFIYIAYKNKLFRKSNQIKVSWRAPFFCCCFFRVVIFA